MNAYWETLVMQLPELPNNLQWKICVNTNIEYEDGKDVEAQTEFYYKKTLKVPPRSVGYFSGRIVWDIKMRRVTATRRLM